MKPIFAAATKTMPRFISMLGAALACITPAYAEVLQTNTSVMLAENQPSNEATNQPTTDDAPLLSSTVQTSSSNVHKPSTAAEKNKRVWDHVLPFGGQQAIYNGYDLPLPFGISFLYTQVQQHQNISNIQVGANSLGGNLSIPMSDIHPDLFRFDNFYTDTKTPQVKVDAWVLPFLNVFATVGKLKGEADLDMNIGGERLLNQVGQHINSCKPGVAGAACRAFRSKLSGALGRDYPIHATAELDGYTYTFGALIAGASGRWFYTMPVSYTQTRMKKTTVDGNTINIQPRVGYGFDLDYGTKLSLYTGAGYMKTSQDIFGSFSLDKRQAIDDINADNSLPFSVHQENQKPWAGIIGLALDVNQYLSADLEYTGLGGDRKQFLFMFNTRF
ncbi:hypothetical protein [Vibrio litoralis]|uniref:hypothetical protein n=1 Tax=Vibrio litoralis TaxID=335972 RepID=UPI001868B86B|nr:hypothetical protein [Vibrio litoralis]